MTIRTVLLAPIVRHRDARFLRAAITRSHSESDRLAYALVAKLNRHPEVLTSQSGNPEWDQWLAERIDECEATRRKS